MATVKSDNHTPLTQQDATLAFAADASPWVVTPAQRAAPPPSALLTTVKSVAKAAQASPRPPVTACQQRLTLNFFFDGTGNNLKADQGTMQHSNVARLSLAVPEDDDTQGRYTAYIPGLGTYFAEIGDPGNTTLGKGMGSMGQERLDWALKKFDEFVKRAEARAQNPTNKIIDIKVNVFGFSRGATAARAFVRDLLATRCSSARPDVRLKQGNYPIQVGFLGLFDTVASVGLPMSTNNTAIGTSAGWVSMRQTLSGRSADPSIGVWTLPFGQPGADPAPGIYDGHASWADGLAVPAPHFVKRCVHMVAGHEIRNSFPVDSVLDGSAYPSGVVEMVYPGAHSDVGGGYQPGEAGISLQPGQMLSLIPLLAMHAEAIAAGVPLRSLAAIAGHSELLRKSFALDTEGAQGLADMVRHFSAYMAAAGSGGRPIGQELLAHMHWYLKWRFYRIHQKLAKGGGAKSRADAEGIQGNERRFAVERAAKEKEVDALKQQLHAAMQRRYQAETRLQQARTQQVHMGTPIPASAQRDVDQSREEEQAARARYLAKKAELDTLANDKDLLASLETYDERLLADAKTLVDMTRRKPKLKLRPHYANLVSAYLDEFENHRGLSDATVIAFFDRYVHDSLAGFATDATLPSDPRVVYVGGDTKLRYAQNKPSDASQTMAA